MSFGVRDKATGWPLVQASGAGTMPRGGVASLGDTLTAWKRQQCEQCVHAGPADQPCQLITEGAWCSATSRERTPAEQYVFQLRLETGQHHADDRCPWRQPPSFAELIAMAETTDGAER